MWDKLSIKAEFSNVIPEWEILLFNMIIRKVVAQSVWLLWTYEQSDGTLTQCCLMAAPWLPTTADSWLWQEKKWINHWSMIPFLYININTVLRIDSLWLNVGVQRAIYTTFELQTLHSCVHPCILQIWVFLCTPFLGFVLTYTCYKDPTHCLMNENPELYGMWLCACPQSIEKSFLDTPREL